MTNKQITYSVWREKVKNLEIALPIQHTVDAGDIIHNGKAFYRIVAVRFNTSGRIATLHPIYKLCKVVLEDIEHDI